MSRGKFSCGGVDVAFITWYNTQAMSFSFEARGGKKAVANEVKVGKNESIDSALRRFKRTCQRAGTLAEVRKREHYEKPSVRRKKKSEAARKRKFR